MNEDIELPNWRFEVTEITAGMYRIRGTRSTGNQVEQISSDPESAMQNCRRDAAKLEEEIIRILKERMERS